MIGGTVIEVCDHPKFSDRIYVNVADRPYSKIEECAIYVERTENSEKIEIGDKIWWQSNIAYWTPQENILLEDDAKHLKCHIDYDIPIPRKGYSGVPHPVNRDESL